MNGGDLRFDSEYSSVAYVAPLARTVGREHQIYSVNSNENTYTNGWTGPVMDAFKLLSKHSTTPRARAASKDLISTITRSLRPSSKAPK